ncbi:MAG: adenine deaminase, partial [Clostridia bacterium]|nr:adenine deaminase [Clostridia bacterium]
MTALLKNSFVVNVFTEELEKNDVLIEDGIIKGVGDYSDVTADVTVDLSGKYICPGFIDGHIHIESTMLTPYEFAKACVPHGTTAVVADPHEIANVCGKDGIRYMLRASEGLPLTVYIMLPSCVPSTSFDESGDTLTAEDLEEFYAHSRVLGLAEVMDYPGVIFGNDGLIKKINSAKAHNAVINGHAPLLSGRDLDKYISAGIYDDHECSSVEEACERIRKGQYIMIRQGTAAKNLVDLLPLFKKP